MKKNILILLLALYITSTYAQKFGQIKRDEIEQIEHPSEPDAKAAILKQHGRTYFEYNKNEGRFELITEVYKKIKIYDESASDLADISVRYYHNKGMKEKVSGIKAVSYNYENNKPKKSELSSKDVYTEETSENWSTKKFAIPNVKKGTVLEYRYKLRSPFVYEIPKWQNQYDIPCDYSEVIIEIPEYFNYNTRTTGGVGINIDTRIKSDRIVFQGSFTSASSASNQQKRTAPQTVTYDTNISTYSASNIPSLKDEDFVYHMNTYRSSIVFELLYTKFPSSTVEYYSSSWNSIAENLQDNSSFGKLLDKKIKSTNQLVESVKDKSPEEKLSIIYNDIKSRIEWNETFSIYASQSLNDTYEKQSGSIADINLLLINTLRKAGITAQPILTKHVYSGLLNQLYPTVSDLNYVMALVLVGEKAIFIDASDSSTDLGYLPTRATNLHGVLIIQNTGEIVEITNPNKDERAYVMKLDIDDELNCTISENAKYSHNASKMLERYSPSSKTEEELIEAFEENKEGIFTESLTIENKTKTFPNYTLATTYESENILEAIGDKLFLDCTGNKGYKTNPFIEENRSYPVFFKNKIQETIVYSISIPEGYELLETPENLNLSMPNGLGTFSFTSNTMKDKVAINSIFKLKTTFLGPEMYGSIKTFFDSIAAKHKEKIVLVKK
jgi:hypothetical protein